MVGCQAKWCPSLQGTLWAPFAAQARGRQVSGRLPGISGRLPAGCRQGPSTWSLCLGATPKGNLHHSAEGEPLVPSRARIAMFLGTPARRSYRDSAEMFHGTPM